MQSWKLRYTNMLILQAYANVGGDKKRVIYAGWMKNDKGIDHDVVCSEMQSNI